MAFSNFLFQLQRLSVGDFGPIYTETQLGRIPVEPFNTYSNLAFLFIVCYFAFQTKLNFRKHPLIVITLPILLVGFVGGTIYHAFRSDRIWLVMDYMPIILLACIASIYFWSRVFSSYIIGVVIGALSFLSLRLVFWTMLPIQIKISAGYLITAFSIIAPAAVYCLRSKLLHGRLILIAGVLFCVALGFRMVDPYSSPYVSIGTHFLWHFFGAASVFSLIKYIYLDDLSRAK